MNDSELKAETWKASRLSAFRDGLRTLPGLKSSPVMTMAIAQTISDADRALHGYDEARAASWKEVMGTDRQVHRDDPRLNDFESKVAVLGDMEVDFVPTKFPREALNLKDNEIPPVVLASVLDHMVEG